MSDAAIVAAQAAREARDRGELEAHVEQIRLIRANRQTRPDAERGVYWDKSDL